MLDKETFTAQFWAADVVICGQEHTVELRLMSIVHGTRR